MFAIQEDAVGQAIGEEGLLIFGKVGDMPAFHADSAGIDVAEFKQERLDGFRHENALARRNVLHLEGSLDITDDVVCLQTGAPLLHRRLNPLAFKISLILRIGPERKYPQGLCDDEARADEHNEHRHENFGHQQPTPTLFQLP